MHVLCDSDWKDVLEDEHEEDSPLRKKAKNTADKFYNLLKLSINTDTNITFDETDYTYIPTSLEEGFNRIKKISDLINIYTTICMTKYYLIGADLAYVKYIQFATKCAKCSEEVDIYSVLTCNECINNNKSKITNYFKQVKAKISYSKPHINFLNSLASCVKCIRSLNLLLCRSIKLKII